MDEVEQWSFLHQFPSCTAEVDDDTYRSISHECWAAGLMFPHTPGIHLNDSQGKVKMIIKHLMPIVLWVSATKNRNETITCLITTLQPTTDYTFRSRLGDCDDAERLPVTA